MAERNMTKIEYGGFIYDISFSAKKLIEETIFPYRSTKQKIKVAAPAMPTPPAEPPKPTLKPGSKIFGEKKKKK